MARALLEVGRRDQLQQRLGIEPPGALAARWLLDRQLHHVEPIGLEDPRKRDLVLPACAVVREERADRALGAPVAAGRLEDGRDIFDERAHPERFGDREAQAQRIARGVALGHQEREHALGTERAHREGEHHRAIDSAGDAHDQAAPAQRAAHLLAERARDLLGGRGRVDREGIAGNGPAGDAAHALFAHGTSAGASCERCASARSGEQHARAQIRAALVAARAPISRRPSGCKPAPWNALRPRPDAGLIKRDLL